MSEAVESTVDLSVDYNNMTFDNQEVFDKLVRMEDLDIKDHKRGAEMHALLLKQAKHASNDASKWVYNLALSVKKECEEINYLVAQAVEDILKVQIGYITSSSCAEVYRMSPKDYGLTGQNALSSAWRKLSGALAYDDFDLDEEGSIRKCDTFRNKKKKEEEKALREKNLAEQKRNTAIMLLTKADKDFDPEAEGSEELILAKIEALDKIASNIAGSDESAQQATKATAEGYFESLDDSEKYSLLGLDPDIEMESSLNQFQSNMLSSLSPKIEEYFQSKVEELGDEDKARDQVDSFIDSMSRALDKKLTKSADRLASVLKEAA